MPTIEHEEIIVFEELVLCSLFPAKYLDIGVIFSVVVTFSSKSIRHQDLVAKNKQERAE